MAEQEQEPTSVCQEVEDDEDNPNYKAPAPKALNEIMNQDADDDSLVKYKQALLGANTNCIIDESNPSKVIINKISLLVDCRDEVSLDLTKPKEELKKEKFILKEGCQYRIKIYFCVQREIVTGLRYEHKVRKAFVGSGVVLEKMRQMMGSYGPKPDLQSYVTQPQEAPSGMLMRGDYKISSKFVDDDGEIYATWDWHLSVKKDWC